MNENTFDGERINIISDLFVGHVFGRTDKSLGYMYIENSMQLKQLKNKLTGHEENEGERLARENAQLQAENNQLSKQLMDIAEKQNNQAKVILP